MRRSRFMALGWMLVRTAGTTAAVRAMPLFCGIGIACAVLFSPQGMEARDVTIAASRSLSFRVLIWLAWLLAATPVASGLFSAPSTAALRSLPIPRWEIAGVLGVMLLVLQAPWMLLWGAGAGAMAGLAAGSLAAALVALSLTRLARWWARVAAAVLVLAVALAPPAAVVIGVALPIGAVAVRAAWVWAPEVRQRGWGWVTGPAPIALSLAHQCRLLRTEQSTLLRGCFVSVLGGLLAGIGARNTEQLEPGAYVAFSLAVMVIPLVIACSGFMAPLSDSASALGWVLDATGTTAAVRIFAERAAMAIWGIVFGMVAGAAAAASSGVAASLGFAAMVLHALWGASLGAMAAQVAADQQRRSRAGGGSPVAGPVFAALAGVGLALAAGGIAVTVMAAATLLWCARSAKARRPARAPLTSEAAVTLMIEAIHVRKRFRAQWVLDGVSFRRDAPGVLVIRGENGAGKSTLLRVVSGVVDLDEGSVTIAGHSLEGDRERALQNVGYVPDVMDLPPHFSVKEWLALVAALKRAALPAPGWIERVGATHLLHERLAALSLGQRRRVCLLAALTGEPRVLVLDEPTNGLDAAGLDMLAVLLKERTKAGLSALVATHEEGFARAVADEVFVLAKGRLIRAGDLVAGSGRTG